MLGWKAPVHTSHEVLHEATNANANELNLVIAYIDRSSNRPSFLPQSRKMKNSGCNFVINTCAHSASRTDHQLPGQREQGVPSLTELGTWL